MCKVSVYSSPLSSVVIPQLFITVINHVYAESELVKDFCRFALKIDLFFFILRAQKVKFIQFLYLWTIFLASTSSHLETRHPHSLFLSLKFSPVVFHWNQMVLNRNEGFLDSVKVKKKWWEDLAWIKPFNFFLIRWG